MYSVKTVNYNSSNLKATQNKDFSSSTGVVTVDKADITVSIDVETADGQKFTTADAEFAIDPTDNTIDFENGDFIITLLFEGDKGPYSVRYDIKNNVFLPDPVDPVVSQESPKTSAKDFSKIFILGLAAFGLCGYLEIKKSLK